MLVVLRFLGALNAAVWLGGAVFFTFGVGPGFFSEDMGRLLPRSHAGAAAQVMIERYFLMQQICGAIALVHLLVEWLYTGRHLRLPLLYLLVSLFGLGVVSGAFLLPRMKVLHYQMYSGQAAAEAVAKARISFGRWHAFSSVLNLVVMGGVGYYFWTFQRREALAMRPTPTIADLPLR